MYSSSEEDDSESESDQSSGRSNRSQSEIVDRGQPQSMLIEEEHKEPNGNIILKKPILHSEKMKKAAPGEAKL